ncbi:MAG: outer membrane protein assembly factor BamA [Treponemataceae bacterium]|nr:outer membrane protein assembly factor BamA [Treponemataceae bacterium]
MRIRRSFICFLFCFLCVFSLFSQSEGWYYNKPINEIKFTGLKSVGSSQMDTVTSEFIGKIFTDDLYVEIINKIYNLDFFDDISVALDPADAKGSSVILNITVVEKPVIFKINIYGNKQIFTTEITDAISLKKSDIFSSSKLPSDERKIRDLYLDKGYTNVRVSSTFEETEDGIVLNFLIEEGKATIVTAIHFQGNEVFSEKTLKKQLNLKEAGLFNKGAFKEALVETDKSVVVSYYKDRGYIDAAVQDLVKKTTYNESKNQDEIELTFIIKEGSSYTYGGLTLSGNVLFTTEELLSFINMKEGDVFNQTKFTTGVYAIANKYYENGYTSNYFSDPKKEIDTESLVISFSMEIIEKPRSHIENVIISGNTKTKDYVIRRELGVESGDIYSLSKIQAGLRNLGNTQFFSAVSPDFVPGSEENLIDMIVAVEEGLTTNIEVGIAFSGITNADEIPVSTYFKWSDTNVAGTGKTISAGVNIASNEKSLNFGYSDSWLFNRPINFSANLEYAKSDATCPQVMALPSGINVNDFYMDYTKRTIGASASLGYRWFPKFSMITLTGGVSTNLNRNDYDATLYTPVDLEIIENHETFGVQNSIWSSLSFDDRDLYYDPSTGWFINQKLTWYGLIPNLENQYFLRSDTKGELYFTLLDKPVSETWNFKLILAGYTGLSFLVPGGSCQISTNNKLFIDGMFTGRGWTDQFRTKGSALWNSYLELRLPIAIGIFGVDFFADAVALKDSLADMFTDLSLDDFRFSFGPGIRFALQQFPIRLLLANTFRFRDGIFEWNNTWQFTLSFTIANR